MEPWTCPRGHLISGANARPQRGKSHSCAIYWRALGEVAVWSHRSAGVETGHAHDLLDETTSFAPAVAATDLRGA
jgi:hypothetical protein